MSFLSLQVERSFPSRIWSLKMGASGTALTSPYSVKKQVKRLNGSQRIDIACSV